MLEFLNPFNWKFTKPEPIKEVESRDDVIKTATMNLARGGYYGTSYVLNYNGEKNLGGIGPVTSYFLDYENFRKRSWKAYLDSELSQTILKKNCLWVIGSGLKLECEPSAAILEYSGISLDVQKFASIVEAKFYLYANSTRCDYAGMDNLHQIAKTSFLNKDIGGDVLVVLRLSKQKNVTIQLIDGQHLRNPLMGSSYIQDAAIAGNIIKDGIEIDANGKHIAYYVASQGLKNNGVNDAVISVETVRIEAESKSSGLTMAFIVYGMKYRIDNVRGIPELAATMETMATLERYKEAMVGSAEEAAKIIYTVEHEAISTGEDPFLDNVKRARGVEGDKMAFDAEGNTVATKITATTNKTAVNMPKGSHLKSFTGGKELYFKDFYTVNAESICAAKGIPFPVAMSKYDSSYSSSRAAIKDWEHTLNVGRKDFTFQFYSRVYAFWLDVEILKGNIQAPGYLQARLNDDVDVLEAYRCSRFVGAAVPHIDPVKEVQASRLKLGAAGSLLPLSTQARETEALNSGEAYHNTEQFAEEVANADKLGIKPAPQVIDYQ